uniref:Uncharacterized protein n=1 Tax=Rhizophora mucronata TaxID=61149 RepID=A0A2P2QQY5_RHIMU
MPCISIFCTRKLAVVDFSDLRSPLYFLHIPFLFWDIETHYTRIV